MFDLCINAGVFLALAIYFDFVDSSNTGKEHSWLFFLYPSFWFKFDRKRKIEDGTDIERHNVPSEDDFEGLSIINASKTYTARSICGVKKFCALKNVSFSIKKGELFALLGHNGAGKTTLINILTGNIPASQGNAKISNSDILDCVSEGKVGLCPQHDILWDELTIREHILLYAALKEINIGSKEEFVDEFVRLVNLADKKNELVSKLSGGMKRRMSIVLATVGEPEVLILDEPTTGLDPVNKRFIWKMVARLKRDRSILLTTHSMDEADYLSDRVSIIKQGEIQCMGTALELKQRYGDGYLLTYVCDFSDAAEAKRLIGQYFPSAKIISESGGSIIMNLPLNGAKEELKLFINLMMNKSKETRLAQLMKENSMNYTTLEEVFLKVNN